MMSGNVTEADVSSLVQNLSAIVQQSPSTTAGNLASVVSLLRSVSSLSLENSLTVSNLTLQVRRFYTIYLACFEDGSYSVALAGLTRNTQARLALYSWKASWFHLPSARTVGLFYYTQVGGRISNAASCRKRIKSLDDG